MTGWLCLAGSGAIVVSLFVPFAYRERLDGSSFRLADNDPWEQIWIATVAGLACLAALFLLGPGRPAEIGRIVVIGMSPVVAATGLGWATVATSADSSVRPGFVLYELGSVCLLGAAALAAFRLQDVRVAVPRAQSAAGLTIVALVIGATAALALGVRAGTDDAWSLASSVVMIAGAIVVPVLSTLVMPRRMGAVLLGAWSVSMLADRLFEFLEPMNAPAALGTALAAALLLAAYLEHSAESSKEIREAPRPRRRVRGG